MGFAEAKRNNTLCKELNIKILGNDSNYFITPAEIRTLVLNQQGKITTKCLNEIKVKAMEDMLKNNPYIADAQVYATLNGILNINIVQKKPIVRIISEGNDSYYLDSKGNTMPLSPDYTALVMVVNGHINEQYLQMNKSNIQKMENDTTVHSLLPSIYILSNYIYHNPFWKAQIPEVYIDSAMEFCLIPRVGNQRIIFGDTTDLEQKFEKLWVLYRDGFSYAGKWNDYSEINLKFNHQIICTKK